jgi:ferredoxin
MAPLEPLNAEATAQAPVATLHLLPLDRRIAVAPGQTLLEAALSAGLRLRSSCRNGTCRECIAELRSGGVRYRVEWPGLSADEKRGGLLLPCVAEPLADVVLWQPRIDRDPASGP